MRRCTITGLRESCNAACIARASIHHHHHHHHQHHHAYWRMANDGEKKGSGGGGRGGRREGGIRVGVGRARVRGSEIFVVACAVA